MIIGLRKLVGINQNKLLFSLYLLLGPPEFSFDIKIISDQLTQFLLIVIFYMKINSFYSL